MTARFHPRAVSGTSVDATPYSKVTAARVGSAPTLVDGTRQVMVENIIKVGTTYYLLYTTNAPDFRLATATSPDGPWTPGTQILTTGSQSWEGPTPNAGCLLEHGGTFYLFYAANTDASVPGIGVATAPAVTGPYTKSASNPILSPGVAGAWDSMRVQEPSVQVMDDGTWIMAFMGEATGTAGASEQVGIATSPAFDGPWTKLAANPVLGITNTATWDGHLVADPSIWQDQSGYWWMQYSGTQSGPGPSGAGLGLAWALDPTKEWHRYGEILAPAGGAGYDGFGVFRGAIYVEGGQYHMPYTAVSSAGAWRGANAILTVASDADLHGHETATDPHPQYLTQAEADARYASIPGTPVLAPRYEVVMTTGTSSPPIPVETPDGTDWVYAEVSS